MRSFYWRSPGSSYGRLKTLVLCTFEVAGDGRKLGTCTCLRSYRTVTCKRQRPVKEMMSRDLTWLEVTWKWRHFTGSHLEVSVEGRKLGFCVRLSSYKSVTHRGGNHAIENVTLPQVSGSDAEVTSFDRNSPASGYRIPNTRALYAFELPQGCNSQELTVTYRKWRQMTSRDRKWPGSDVIPPAVTWR